MLETVLTSLLDQFKGLRQYKTKVILVVCLIFFLLGLPLCCDVSIKNIFQFHIEHAYLNCLPANFSAQLISCAITSHPLGCGC